MKIVIVVLVLIALLFAVGIGIGFNQSDEMTAEEIPSWISGGLGGLLGGFQDEVDLERIPRRGSEEGYTLDKQSRTLTLTAGALTLSFVAVGEDRGVQGASLKLISGPAVRALYIDAESEEQPDSDDDESWATLPRKDGDKKLHIAVRSVGGALKLDKLGGDASDPSCIAFE